MPEKQKLKWCNLGAELILNGRTEGENVCSIFTGFDYIARFVIIALYSTVNSRLIEIRADDSPVCNVEILEGEQKQV